MYRNIPSVYKCTVATDLSARINFRSNANVAADSFRKSYRVLAGKHLLILPNRIFMSLNIKKQGKLIFLQAW